MHIRKAESGDAQAVFDIRKAAIGAQCVGYYADDDLMRWTAGEMTDAFKAHIEAAAYVALVDDVIVGTCILEPGTGKVGAIFVNPAWMRQGIGRQMMAHLERLAIAAGLAELYLDATLNAAPFYRLLGFVGEAVAVYESPRGISLACIPMRKRIFNPAAEG